MAVSPVQKTAILIAALTIFVVGLGVSLHEAPELLHEARLWPWTLGVAVSVLLMILLNGYEFLLMGKVLGQRRPYTDALVISIIASAANMLPLPGGLAAKTIALKSGGSTLFLGVMTNLLFTVIWLALALLLTGLSLLAFDATGPGLMLFVGGCAALVAVLVIGPLKYNISLTLLIKASLLRLAILLVFSAMTCFALWSLGEDLAMQHSAAFTLASILGAAFSVVPAGLGLREIASSAVAPLVSVSPYVAFLAAALTRVVAMTILIPLSILLATKSSSGMFESDGI